MSIPFLKPLELLRGGLDESRRETALHQEVTMVFERYRAPIFRYACGVLQDAGEAEDITQEAFLRFYRELKNGRDLAPRGWLFRVAHNLAIDRVRDRSQVTTVGEARWNDLCQTTADDRQNIHADVLRIEQRQRLNAISQVLSDQEKRCIDLRLEGLRYREISEILGIGISSIENYVGRAVKKIVREFDA